MMMKYLSRANALRRVYAGSFPLLRNTERSRARVTPVKWTLADLRAACERKRIRYEETPVYENLRGVVVSYGRTSIISVKQTLPEREKIAVLAHELAHIALEHTHDRPQYMLPSMGDDGSQSFDHDPEKEHQAQIWAAHLLVQPEVFDQLLSDAQASGASKSHALRLAAEQTASALNIPLNMVKLWTQTRDWPFQETPRAWLARS